MSQPEGAISYPNTIKRLITASGSVRNCGCNSPGVSRTWGCTKMQQLILGRRGSSAG